MPVMYGIARKYFISIFHALPFQNNSIRLGLANHNVIVYSYSEGFGVGVDVEMLLYTESRKSFQEYSRQFADGNASDPARRRVPHDPGLYVLVVASCERPFSMLFHFHVFYLLLPHSHSYLIYYTCIQLSSK